MRGTEKQVAWAEDLKAKYANDVDALIAKLSAAAAPTEAQEKGREVAIAALEVSLDNDNARWWIDNKPGTIEAQQIAKQAVIDAGLM